MSNYLPMMIEAAKLAGALQRKHFRKLAEKDIETKAGAIKDPVTFVDRESERLIFEHLRQAFPDHGFVGEEEHNNDTPQHFLVDPLDGTANYTIGLPFFAVSIARMVNRQPEDAVIYLPALDECYSASLGHGAFCDGEAIQVSPWNDLRDGVQAFGFACVRAGEDSGLYTAIEQVAKRSMGVRRCGSAAIDLTYVARGIFTGFWESSLSPWDVAAGCLLVREAGGMVTGYAQGHDPVYDRRILASNGKIHQALKALVEDALP